MKNFLYVIVIGFLWIASQSGTRSMHVKKDPERFKHYQALDKKNESLEVIYLTWPDKNLPNFVKLSDYKKYASTNELIEYCFYIDSKKEQGPEFSDKMRDQFIKKIPVKLKGKFFVTKQFDDNFPTKDFEELRRMKELGFKLENDDYKVFVID